MNKNLIITLLLVVIVGVGGFVGGIKYQQGKQPIFNRQLGNGQGGGSPRRSLGGGGPVNGDIIASTDKSITVKLTDGSSKIILFSASTTINKASEATTADLTVGQKVAVFGTTNADGSVTAQNIQLNPVYSRP
ncbi:MAG: DUF5666 domain-containing protein [Candidatus Beckwithbacteria bacterium]|nr:DUF5666 domain-containing protein [Candidatus Beckwithbacteria bacterium]